MTAANNIKTTTPSSELADVVALPQICPAIQTVLADLPDVARAGIGLAVANYLIGKSHNVVLLARNEEALKEVQHNHEKQVQVLAGNLSDFSLARQAVNLAVKQFGQLDGLVINHGAMFGVQKVANCEIEEWRKMFDINFFSAVALSKAAVPELRKSKGCIVYTSSGASTGVYSTWGAYSASKAAMNALARQIACEEPDVTAFAIRPGVVDTDMQRELRDVHSAVMDEKDNTKFRNAHRNQTLLKPEQPGHVMARLVIDPDQSLNGQYLRYFRLAWIGRSPGEPRLRLYDRGDTELIMRCETTVQKIVSEILTTPSLNTAPDSSVTFARDARELLIECCVEFITLISSEANEIAEKEQKKTIAIEHIDKALRELGFPEYVKEVLASAGDAKEMLKTREKKTSKMDQSGLTQEELLEQQQALFRSATDKYNQAT
ncbi:MAG: hypothetical protein Q9163_000447 [Psora crenata]